MLMTMMYDTTEEGHKYLCTSVMHPPTKHSIPYFLNTHMPGVPGVEVFLSDDEHFRKI